MTLDRRPDMIRTPLRAAITAGLGLGFVVGTALPAVAAAAPPPAASCQGFVNGFVNSTVGGTGQGNQEFVHQIGGVDYSDFIVDKAQRHPC